MNSSSQNSANPLIAKVQQLFSRDLALENDYLCQENRIFRSKLGARVPLTETDRRILVKYGLRIKDRLAEVISIAQPAPLLAGNRQQKRKKWTFQNSSAKGPRKASERTPTPCSGPHRHHTLPPRPCMARQEFKTGAQKNCKNDDKRGKLDGMKRIFCLWLRGIPAALLVLVAFRAGMSRDLSAQTSRGVPMHPLDSLTADEINSLREIVLTQGGFSTNTLFIWAQLREPPKDKVLAFAPGMVLHREAEVVAISPEKKTSFEIRVDLGAGKIETVKPLENSQPFLANPEFALAQRIVNNAAEVRAALEKRGYQINGNISDRFFLDTYAPDQKQ